MLRTDWLKLKHRHAEFNTRGLRYRGAVVHHNVDVKRMTRHLDLLDKKFDRIVFNLPHAGFRWVEDDLRMIAYVFNPFRTLYINSYYVY